MLLYSLSKVRSDEVLSRLATQPLPEDTGKASKHMSVQAVCVRVCCTFSVPNSLLGKSISMLNLTLDPQRPRPENTPPQTQKSEIIPEPCEIRGLLAHEALKGLAG